MYPKGFILYPKDLVNKIVSEINVNVAKRIEKKNMINIKIGLILI
jgi:hypothetical protein